MIEKLFVKIPHFLLEAPFFNFSRKRLKENARGYENGRKRLLRVRCEKYVPNSFDHDVFLAILFLRQYKKERFTVADIAKVMGKSARSYHQQIKLAIKRLATSEYFLTNILSKNSNGEDEFRFLSYSTEKESYSTYYSVEFCKEIAECEQLQSVDLSFYFSLPSGLCRRLFLVLEKKKKEIEAGKIPTIKMLSDWLPSIAKQAIRRRETIERAFSKLESIGYLSWKRNGNSYKITFTACPPALVEEKRENTDKKPATSLRVADSNYTLPKTVKLENSPTYTNDLPLGNIKKTVDQPANDATLDNSLLTLPNKKAGRQQDYRTNKENATVNTVKLPATEKAGREATTTTPKVDLSVREANGTAKPLEDMAQDELNTAFVGGIVATSKADKPKEDLTYVDKMKIYWSKTKIYAPEEMQQWFYDNNLKIDIGQALAVSNFDSMKELCYYFSTDLMKKISYRLDKVGTGLVMNIIKKKEKYEVSQSEQEALDKEIHPDDYKSATKKYDPNLVYERSEKIREEITTREEQKENAEKVFMAALGNNKDLDIDSISDQAKEMARKDMPFNMIGNRGIESRFFKISFISIVAQLLNVDSPGAGVYESTMKVLSS